MSQGKPNSVRISALPLIALVAALLATLACARANALLNPKTAAESLIAGQEAYSAGDYDQAIADLTAAIASDPQMAAAYAARGDVYYLIGSYALAIDDYTQAIDLGFTPPAQVLSARADAYMALGDGEQVAADYQAAQAADEAFSVTYYPARQQVYTQAIEQHPDLASAYYARGWTEFWMQDADGAIADLTQALELGHEPALPVYLRRAQLHQFVGHEQAAIDDYTAAITLAPDLVEAYETRGFLYIQVGDYELGLTDLQTAIELDPGYATGHNNLCWFGSLLGQATAVMDSCDQAVALAPDVPAFWDSRGVARALTGDMVGAIEDFQRYVDFFVARGEPDETRAYWLSELRSGRNPFDDATIKALLENEPVPLSVGG